MSTVTIIGAGGKMGCRLTDNLAGGRHDLRCVEISSEGIERLAERGIEAVAQARAVGEADFVILAVPDVAIGRISKDVVPEMKAGAMLITLDPAAAYLGRVHMRDEIRYFVTHPCHPPVFNDETDPAAQTDYFGGVAAKQAIVCALMQGDDDDYSAGEELAREFYAPVMRAHRISVEEMAMLEPAMAETVGASCAMLLREAMDEAVKRGVPEAAARDFMLGHLRIELAIAFGFAGNPFSDAALVAIEYGKRHLFKPDWKRVFEPEKVGESIEEMLGTRGRADRSEGGSS